MNYWHALNRQSVITVINKGVIMLYTRDMLLDMAREFRIKIKTVDKLLTGYLPVGLIDGAKVYNIGCGGVVKLREVEDGSRTAKEIGDKEVRIAKGECAKTQKSSLFTIQQLIDDGAKHGVCESRVIEMLEREKSIGTMNGWAVYSVNGVMQWPSENKGGIMSDLLYTFGNLIDLSLIHI